MTIELTWINVALEILIQINLALNLQTQYLALALLFPWNQLVEQSNLLKGIFSQNGFLNGNWKPYMANIVLKSVFLFQVEIKKNCLQVLCTTDRAAPDQMTIPLNKLPCGRMGYEPGFNKFRKGNPNISFLRSLIKSSERKCLEQIL